MDSATAKLHIGANGVRVTVIETIGGRDTMEDAHAIHIGSTTQPVERAYVAVFDGHGGRKASTWAANHLHEYVWHVPQTTNDLQAAFEQAEEAYRESITSCCGLVRSHEGGTTVAVVTLQRSASDGNFLLTTSHCGDSRILTLDLLNQATRTFGVLKSTVDHKPERASEKERITKLGGSVHQFRGRGPMRVQGYLGVSRSLGDFAWKKYVCCTPDVSEPVLLTPGAKVLIACDGLFDLVNNDEVAWLLAHYGDNPCDAVERLRNIAIVRGSLDNITIALIDFVRPVQ